MLKGDDVFGPSFDRQ